MAEKYKYLVVASGEDEGRMREFVKKALSHLVPDDLRDFNYDRVNGAEAEATTIATLAETPPMMAERRVLHIEDAQKLSKAAQEALIAQIDAAAARPSGDIAFVVVYGEGKSPPKAVKDRAGRLEECGKLKWPSDGERWVRDYVRSIGRQMDGEAVSALVTQVGHESTGRLKQEIEKLTLVVPEGPITADAVFRACGVSAGRNIYALCDAIATRSPDAPEILDEVLRDADFPGVRIAISLSYHFVDLARMRAQMDGHSAGNLKMPPWKEKKLRPQANLWTSEELDELIDLLAETDLELKSGTKDRVALQAFIMRAMAIRPVPTETRRRAATAGAC